ncbi:DUF4922 domain-containing protein [Dysgonomonas sp. 520]|uniref:DUF4922 domain-containing protein n=1 Tax=Dysgonomonas sp. 520 TaxID=2302931 RepID=UPI0013D73B8E|nr:DUF4922 domain-containing protein [Dysgonomonas sp. 520]NDW10362.1 DUF4922 domain-containing protein [Dysgonomonas sp. 520]
MSVTSRNIKNLLAEQLKVWDLARSNYAALANVETKDFRFDGFDIRVQFNPARIQSTAAKVDTKSIQERKCFLCPINLPVIQEGIPYGKEYQILVNPFPIFPQHFTIPSYHHVDQLILNRYGDMLDLAKDLDEFTIFYNGPKCGASAPDHVHFQAGNKGFMPIEEDCKNVEKSVIIKENGLSVYTLKNYLRNFFLIESDDKDKAIAFFKKLYSLLEVKDGEKEPMMNIITWYENGTWFSCIFPREKHRPICFYEEGEKNILISPASVDMGGVFITPQEKDFKKVTTDDITRILKEVCISDKKMQQIIEKVNQ